MTNNEKKFWNILNDLFVGAEVKGKSGFINLMIAKQNYFGKVKEELLIQIEEICKNNKDFKDELYDKLYSFFIDILVFREVLTTITHHFFIISIQKPMVIIKMIPESSQAITSK